VRKLCEDKDLIICWYTNTESLILRGERANEVKDRIISFAQSENNLEKSESNRPFQDEEVSHNISGITPTVVVMKKKPHSILDENTLEDLRFEMMAFITTTNDKFEALTKDIKILKQDKAHDHTDNSRLLAEIQKLQAENNEQCAIMCGMIGKQNFYLSLIYTLHLLLVK
jgi:hypothetical protein